MPTTGLPEASDLADGDSGDEEAYRQPGRRAVHGSLRAENRSFHWHLSDRQEEEQNIEPLLKSDIDGMVHDTSVS